VWRGEHNNMKISLINIIILSTVLSIGCGGSKSEEIEPFDKRFERGKAYFDDGKFRKSITELRFVTFNAPGSELGDDAQFYLAESHYGLKEYILAISEYERLARIHPESPFVEDAGYKRALCFDNLSPKAQKDQTNTFKAIAAYQEFIEDWPLSEYKVIAEERLDNLRFKLAKKKFEAGKQYQKLGECESSLIYMEQVLEQYYDSEFAPQARWSIAECNMKLKNWEEALKSLADIITRNENEDIVSKAREAIQEVRKQAADSAGEKALSGNN